MKILRVNRALVTLTLLLIPASLPPVSKQLEELFRRSAPEIFPLPQEIQYRAAAPGRKSRELAKRLSRASAQKPDTDTAERATHTVKSGDTLSRIWTSFGSSTESAMAAQSALQGLGIGAHKLRSGEDLAMLITKDGGIERFRRTLSDGRVVSLKLASDSSYTAILREPKIIERERIVSGVITSSLAGSAHGNSVPYSIIDEVVDLFSPRIEFSRNVHPGDTWTLIYSEQVDSRGEVVRSGGLRSASITSNGKFMAAVRYKGSDGKDRFYDQNGNPVGSYFLRYPLKFTRISSVFSKSRFHPVMRVRRPHNGVDFAAPAGTSVRSVADGVVDFAGWDRGGGNMIRIRHDKRFSTAYLHLSRISAGVRRGMSVSRGEIIGAVGKSGLATGPHLHFSLYDRGRYVDPLTTGLPALAPGAQKIPADFLMAALNTLKAEGEKVMLAFSIRPSKRKA